MTAAKEDIINKLRKDILQWEGFRPPQPGTTGSIGLGPVEKAFPNGVFPTGTIHEFSSLCPEDTAACGGFVAGLVKTLLDQAVPAYGSAGPGAYIRHPSNYLVLNLIVLSL